MRQIYICFICGAHGQQDQDARPGGFITLLLSTHANDLPWPRGTVPLVSPIIRGLIGPVQNDLTGSCTASGGANKIAVRLAATGAISCGPSCTEQFLLNDNYLLGVTNPGAAFDDWLSPESVLTASFDLDGIYLGGASFSIEVMAIFDEFLIDASEFP